MSLTANQFFAILKGQKECVKAIELYRWGELPRCPKCGSMKHVSIKDEGDHYVCQCRWCRPQRTYIWKVTPLCPYCGSTEKIKRVRVGLLDLYQCSNCRPRKQFNVLTRTLLQRTKIPLVKWFKVWHYERQGEIPIHSLGNVVGYRKIPMHRYAKLVDLGYREIRRIKEKIQAEESSYAQRGGEKIFYGSYHLYRFFLRLQFGADYVRSMCILREPKQPELKRP